MKIWYQSTSPYKVRREFDDYWEGLKEHCKRAARPDTEVHVEGVPVEIPEVDRFKSVLYFASIQVIGNMIKAGKEGYDAVVIGSSLECGLAEGREMLGIPVVGILQACAHVASLLGERFACVTGQPYFFERYRQQIRNYGLSEKFIPNYYGYPVSDEEMAASLKQPEFLAGKFREAAKKAVADGATVIIPLAAYIPILFHRAGGLTKVDGATVLDSIEVLVKTGEMLADLNKLGMECARNYGVYGSPGKEILKRTYETYAPYFNMDCLKPDSAKKK